MNETEAGTGAGTKHELIENHYIRLIEENKVFAGDQLPTEHEIAALFGVSRHTVRQALTYLAQEGWIYKERGKGSFYSSRKSNISTARKTIAVLTTYLSDYIFPNIISGIEEELRRRGYNLMLFSSGNDIDAERSCFETIIHQDISGLIVEPAQSMLNNLHHESIKQLEQNNIKYIAINANCDEENSAFIVVDDEQGGFKLTNYLLELGHQNIAAIFKADDLQGQKRKRGYEKALEQYELTPNPEVVGEYMTGNEEMYIEHFIKRLLALTNKPTALVCYNDKVALQVIEICRRDNIRIPGDLSIVSFDDSMLAVSSDIKLTTIRHPKEDMGILAAKCIIDMIEQKIDKPQYTYPAELIVRESCTRL